MKSKALKIFVIFILLTISSFGLLTGIVNAFAPSSDVIYQGIDVSAYQGEIDYNRVKDYGIEIVYIKASEGTYLEDPFFRRNYDNAKANGLKVGFYHFIRARSNEEAIREAEFFSSVISNTTPDCRLAMDFEVFGELDNEEINSISRTFLTRVQELTGKEMVVYSDTYNAEAVFSIEIANQYPLWVAQYEVETPSDNGKWESWVGFQYTDIGQIDGINGYVDRDKFTQDIFLSSNEVIPKPVEPPTENTNIYYIVRQGDTLSHIALWYNTTVEELVRLNNIQNPNLIYVGQKILITTSGDPNKQNQIVYVVKRGDNLTKIAKKYGTTVGAIVALNNMKNPNLIYPGQRLLININNSNSDIHSVGHIYYRVKRGDTLWRIARRYNTTIYNIVRLNNIRNSNRIYIGQVLKISN